MFSVEQDATGVVIKVYGDLDIESSPRLKEILAALDDLDRTVRLDLTNSSYIDSTGIGVLIAAKRLRSERFCAKINDEGNIARVLEICGMLDVVCESMGKPMRGVIER